MRGGRAQRYVCMWTAPGYLRICMIHAQCIIPAGYVNVRTSVGTEDTSMQSIYDMYLPCRGRRVISRVQVWIWSGTGAARRPDRTELN